MAEENQPTTSIDDKATPTQENQEVVIIKRKKGRPRKEIVETIPTVPEEKKR